MTTSDRPATAPPTPPTGVKAILIADIRGYSRFTAERGDEAAAELAVRFATAARAAVEGHDGRLVELRGDEALAVFSSPRQAVRAAVDLQASCVAETLADPSYPLTVGVGLDAGEAVAVEEGFRGGALNLAARLCAQAGAGEVLASRELVHLARAVDGVRYTPRGEVSLKGLGEPVHVVGVEPVDGDFVQALAPFVAVQPRQARRRRAVLLAAAGLAVVAAAVAIPLALSGGSGGGRGADGGGDHAPALLVAPANSVGLLDARTGALLAAVELPSAPGAIAATGDAVWVTTPDDGRIVRIDPASRTIADTIPVGTQPSGIAVTPGAVWVVEQGGPSLERIDPDTGTVVATVRVGNGPAGLAVGGGAVWVANRLADTVQRIDEDTGEVTATVAVGAEPVALAVGAGAVWVACSGAGAVYRLDSASGSVTQVIPVGNGPSSIALVGGKVWVGNALDGTVSAIDPDAGAVTATVNVGGIPAGLAASSSGLWVADELNARISEIDVTRSAVTRTARLGTTPHGLALAGSGLWVAVRGTASSHRGGTLHVAYEQPPDSIDPGYAYTFGAWQVLALTNDGLVDFKRVGGPEGGTLVPNLAARLPLPTDGGRTYTFQLRQGVMYSDGRQVLASDVRRGIERAIHAGQVPFSIDVGGNPTCRLGEPCDLTQSILTDDVAGTITFHLSAPDPEFLTKLALPIAYPVPPGTPVRDVGNRPLPATGPYRIESFDGKRLVLVRNPHFHVWSSAAQPGGNVDTVVIRYGVKADDALIQVEHGNDDLAGSLRPSPAQLAKLTTTYAGQLHPQPVAAAYFLALNTRVPPFDDVRVRRAFNYAIDRGAIVEAVGAGRLAHATCQVLPPNFPGYEPYCPYTRDAGPSGRWKGPDLAKARELVRASGTAGMPVTIWLSPGIGGEGVGVAIGRQAVAALSRLGYRASTHVIEDQYFPQIYDPSTRQQVALSGWIEDYPAASNFLANQLICKTYRPDAPALNQNLAAFCNPAIDAMVERALALEATDQAGARSLWARIDRALVDEAPYVPLFNPVALDVVSARVGNYQSHPLWGVLFDQLWVR